MSCLPKPVLRGHIKKMGLKFIIGALSFATINCTLYNFLYRVPKIKAYEEFYKNYDVKAHYLDLVNWGYFQTVRPEDLRNDED